MKDKRLKEIKDSIDLQLELSKQLNVRNELILEEKELYEYVEKLKTQQQEFIKYLEEPIKIIIDGNPTNISEYTVAKLDTLKEVLKKYKEIVGAEDD